MKIVLYKPQIPQNTGNIVRTCSVTGSELVLVEPLGFSTKDRWLKRAGLDYWEGVNVNIINDLEYFLLQQSAPFFFFSSKVTELYSSKKYSINDILIFGSETEGLPSGLLANWPERTCRIPMLEGSRCLNLATSVGIVLYEAWRQQNFGLK